MEIKRSIYLDRVIGQEYGLNVADAKVLFEHVWIHTFGIGALCATGMCNFSVEKISEMLSEDFIAMMMLIKSGNPTPELFTPITVGSTI